MEIFDSTSVTADADGNLRSRTLYSACPLAGGLRTGEVRHQAGASPTKYTYTGQYSNTADFGLMRVAYRARWLQSVPVAQRRGYDPSLGRFRGAKRSTPLGGSQADTVVPGAGNPMAWDRYAYALNNSLRYSDPSGHCAEGADYDYDACMQQLESIQQQYGVAIAHVNAYEFEYFTPENLKYLDLALSRARGALGAEKFDEFVANSGAIIAIDELDWYLPAGEKALGYWDGTEGTAIIDPSAMASGMEFAATVVHELIGHGYIESDWGYVEREKAFEEYTEWDYREMAKNPNNPGAANPGTGPTATSRLTVNSINEDIAETAMVLIMGGNYRDYNVTAGRISWFRRYIGDPNLYTGYRGNPR